MENQRKKSSAGKPYQVDITFQSTDDKPAYYYFAMSDDAAERTGHGPSEAYFVMDALMMDKQNVSIPCTDTTYDIQYR